MTIQNFTIKLPEAEMHRRVLLMVLQEIDYHLPLNTANISLTVRLENDRDFWSLYSAMAGVFYTCEAAPKELAELSQAVETVLDEMEIIIEAKQKEYLNDSL